MAEQSYLLITFYKGWETYQQSLVEVIEQLSSEQLALPMTSDGWTIGMVAQHIVANRVWWFQVWMGQGNPDLAPIAHWDPQDVEGVSPHSAAELVAGLKSTWELVYETLNKWTGADLEYHCLPPSALREDELAFFAKGFSRQWIIWHTLEHEIHHGGELSLALGKLGLEGIYGNA